MPYDAARLMSWGLDDFFSTCMYLRRYNTTAAYPYRPLWLIQTFVSLARLASIGSRAVAARTGAFNSEDRPR